MARCARKSCGCWRPDLLIHQLTLGLWVDAVWFCSPECVAADAARRLRLGPAHSSVPNVLSVPPLRLGVLLLHQGAITTTQLNAGLRAQRESGRRLGAELVRLGMCTPEVILKGLAAQGGVSYLSAVHPARVRITPGGLSADEVRALGLVPVGAIEADRMLMVACAAPVPRAALAALVQLTGWNAQPYLVSDPDFELLMTAYGGAAPAPGPATHFVKVLDVDDAERRIAAAVSDERRISMTEAHCAPFTWVRVAGARAINTLVVPYEQEPVCQVATTSR
jgi:hypothetical protein